MVAPGILDRRTDDYPFQHVDLAPTILNLLGQEAHPNFQGVNVLANDRGELESRMLFFHVLSPIARSNAVQYAGRWKFMTSYENKLGALYDLENDPTESTDVSNRYPLIRKALSRAVEQWEKEQLAYYNFASYYRDFYPPKQPKIEEVCEAAGIDFGELLMEANSFSGDPQATAF